MISIFFIGIALMFFGLACASHVTKSWLKKPHSEMIKAIDRTIAHEKEGAKGWASLTTFLYKIVNAHFYFEIAGFLLAAFAAIIEFLSAYGW
jgi:hypothetical protein